MISVARLFECPRATSHALLSLQRRRDLIPIVATTIVTVRRIPYRPKPKRPAVTLELTSPQSSMKRGRDGRKCLNSLFVTVPNFPYKLVYLLWKKAICLLNQRLQRLQLLLQNRLYPVVQVILLPLPLRMQPVPPLRND